MEMLRMWFQRLFQYTMKIKLKKRRKQKKKKKSIKNQRKKKKINQKIEEIQII